MTYKKICNRCKAEKEISEFYKEAVSKDGHQPRCKKCENDRKLPYQRKNRNKDTRIYQRLADELKKQNLKKCPKCKIIKNFDGFYTAGKSGYSTYCIICMSEIAKKNIYSTEKKERYNRNKDVLRNKKLKYYFGITLEEYNEMLLKQDGVCKICLTKQENKALAVDHDHTTGKIRGLLCSMCNTAIGLLKENIKTVNSLAAYLAEHQEKEQTIELFKNK